MKKTMFVAFTALATIAIGCGSPSSGSSSHPGFGSSGSGTPSNGNAGGGSGAGGGTAVGGGSTSGDKSGTGPGDPSTPVDPGANGPPADPNAPCNDFTVDATQVTVQNTNQSMPTGTGGGQPLDGYYQLTAVQHFGNGANDTYIGEVFLSSGIFQFAITKNGTQTRTTYAADYVDPSLTLTARCGASDVKNLTYTAPTETQIILYDSTAKIAYTYTRPDPASTP